MLEPFWTFPDHPSLAEAGRTLFLDPGSAWLPLIPVTRDRLDSPYENLINSPLLGLPAFREAVLAPWPTRSRSGPLSASPMAWSISR